MSALPKPAEIRRIRNAAALALECNEWNSTCPIGTKVAYRSHPTADPLHTVTTSPAEVLSDHTAVAWVVGVRGCVALSSLTVEQ